jgi:hypothetical protein
MISTPKMSKTSTNGVFQPFAASPPELFGVSTQTSANQRTDYLRQRSTEHPNAHNSHCRAGQVQPLHSFAVELYLVDRISWHRKYCDGTDYQVHDSQQPEARSPVEKLSGQSRENDAENEAKRISATEAAEHAVLPLRWLGVNGTQHALRWRDRGGSEDTKDSAKNVGSESGFGEPYGKAEDGE